MPSPFAKTRAAARLPLWLLFPLFFAAVDLSHWRLLRLPYFWDEGGYYIPAALDFFHTGTLIPQSTITNAHPPLPSILLAGWWHFAGLAIVNTRTLVALVAAAALLAVFRLTRALTGDLPAAAVTLLTALYPVWFAQSTLAHADIFAAAFTLWGLSVYLQPVGGIARPASETWALAALFSLAALSKETAIVTPLALAALELRRRSLKTAAALLFPVVPLAAWYAFHYAKTGFVFGNPEFLRYNASANLDAHRLALSFYHRLLHMTLHMNLFVPVLATLAVLLLPARKPGLPRPVATAIWIILAANLAEFSLLGGALLTRYLLPMYPLVLLLCVVEWERRLTRWGWLAGLSATAFLMGIWVNPPYAFAPEDNLTYRDMIVLHQRAIAILNRRFPDATVLSAWPATAELSRPELGYTRTPFRTTAIPNFAFAELQKAAQDPAAYDTALLFSTKWEPPPGTPNFAAGNQPADARYFDFHHDLRPVEAAALLHGEIIWQAQQGGEWAAILHFPRIVNARAEARNSLARDGQSDLRRQHPPLRLRAILDFSLISGQKTTFSAATSARH